MNELLTIDNHFGQEGFWVLMRRAWTVVQSDQRLLGFQKRARNRSGSSAMRVVVLVCTLALFSLPYLNPVTILTVGTAAAMAWPGVN